jgi:uncharacterized membrane protein
MRGDYIAIPVVIGIVAYAVVTIVRLLLENIRRSKSERLQADLYTKVIDKLGSSPELAAWLESEKGITLMQVEPKEQPGAQSRILNSAQFGIMGAAVGGAMLWLGRVFHGEPQEVLMIFGTVILAAGGGLVIAGAVAYFLSRHLGLLNGAKSGN